MFIYKSVCFVGFFFFFASGFWTHEILFFLVFLGISHQVWKDYVFSKTLAGPSGLSLEKYLRKEKEREVNRKGWRSAVQHLCLEVK